MNDPVRRDEKGGRLDDESTVREKSVPAPPSAPNPRASSPSLTAGGMRDRLEQKLRRGRALLASLPGGDDRARLLHVAIMRRDESLLDGVLSALGVEDSVPPKSK